MSDKRQQLSILDQWATQSGQVSRSTERLSEIAKWIDWEPLYAIGCRIYKTRPQGGQPRKTVRWMIRGLFLGHLYPLSDPQLEDHLIGRLSFRRFSGLPLDQRAIFGDKAYPPKDLKTRCRQEETYYGILDKAYRNSPMSVAPKARNTGKRRVQRYVEHPFAAIKNRYGMRVAKAKTKLRNKARFALAAICWNIERNISWAKKDPNLTPVSAL